MILKADISKTSTGSYIFLFIFICGNSKCTRIQKIKNFSGEVNWVPLALTALTVIIHRATHEDILLSHAFFAYEGAGQMPRAAAI